MKRWTPYVVACVIGVGLAVAAFPTRNDKDGAGARARIEARAAKKAAAMKENAAATASSVASAPQGSEPAEPSAEPVAGPDAEPPGSEATASIGAPAPPEAPGVSAGYAFGRHVAQTAPFWAQVAKELGGTNEKLSLDAAATARFMRDQARLSDPDVGYAIGKEAKMIERVRGQVADPRVTTILDYLAASGSAAQRGEDPRALPQPTQGTAP